MQIKNTNEVECEFCKEKITLREYRGMEGAWYTDHHCMAIDVVDAI